MPNMIEGFILDGLPANQFPYLRCDITRLERLCTEAHAILEKLEEAKKGVAALSVFHSRLHSQQIVRFNVQSIKTTASARYSPLLTEGFDLSTVPTALFVELVCFLPIPYLKTLASHDETLRHAMELTTGRSLHAQWGAYYTFLMKVNQEWAQKFFNGGYMNFTTYALLMLTGLLLQEVQAHLSATKSEDPGTANGKQRNDDFRGMEYQSGSVVVAQHLNHSTADPVLSMTTHGVQPSNSDQSHTDARETMYLRALRAKEKEWGPEHLTTLDTVVELGSLYADEGRRPEAERILFRALRGYEKVEAGSKNNHEKQEASRKLEQVRSALTRI